MWCAPKKSISSSSVSHVVLAGLTRVFHTNLIHLALTSLYFPPSAPPNIATCRWIPRNEVMWHDCHRNTSHKWSHHFISARGGPRTRCVGLSRRIIGHCPATNGCSIATKHTEARLPVLKTDARESLFELICDNTYTFRTVTCASKLVVVTLPSCESSTSRNRTPIKYRLPKSQTISGLPKNSRLVSFADEDTKNPSTNHYSHHIATESVEEFTPFCVAASTNGALPTPFRFSKHHFLLGDWERKTQTTQTTHTIRAQLRWEILWRLTHTAVAPVFFFCVVECPFFLSSLFLSSFFIFVISFFFSLFSPFFLL